MKYIRTKESINPVERQEDIELFERTNQRLADTIEELCDEFVVAYKDSEPYLTQHLSYAEMEEYNASLVGNGGIVYGAIWTDKGLIYVAKMNDKGVLELL